MSELDDLDELEISLAATKEGGSARRHRQARKLMIASAHRIKNSKHNWRKQVRAWDKYKASPITLAGEGKQ